MSIAIVVAVVFSWVRGGVRDEPIVLMVFGLLGLVASVSVTFGVEWTRQMDAWAAASPAVTRWRSVVAGAWALGTLGWAGPLISSGGFGSWLVAVVVLFGTSMVSAVIAVSSTIAFGVLTVTCVTVSLILNTLESGWGGYDLVVQSWSVYLGIWLVGVALSCASSVPLHARRRHPARSLNRM